MNINRLRVLRGPNLWSRHTAIEAIVSCSPDESIIVDSDPFEKRMRGLFPALGALKAEVRPEPLSLPRALELAALAFQAQAGCPVTFSCTVATREPGIFQVVVEY
ncbi:MAG: cyanophycin synthetase, partial [Burkholderiales bacterium]